MIVLVTGASSGLGAATARIFAGAGLVPPFPARCKRGQHRQSRGFCTQNARAYMDRNESALYGPTRIVTWSAGEVKGNDSKPQDAAGESRKRVDTQGLDAVASGGVNVS